jgi:hypothetical protein
VEVSEVIPMLSFRKKQATVVPDVKVVTLVPPDGRERHVGLPAPNRSWGGYTNTALIAESLEKTS